MTVIDSCSQYIKDKRIQQMMNQTLQEYQEKLFKVRKNKLMYIFATVFIFFRMLKT